MLITGIYWLVGWYRERPAKPARYEIILKQLMKKLSRYGLTKAPSETPNEFLQRVQSENQFKDPQLENIFTAYNRIKYAQGYQKQTIINRFGQMVAQWKFPST
jgi:hypothetical protein